MELHRKTVRKWNWSSARSGEVTVPAWVPALVQNTISSVSVFLLRHTLTSLYRRWWNSFGKMSVKTIGPVPTAVKLQYPLNSRRGPEQGCLPDNSCLIHPVLWHKHILRIYKDYSWIFLKHLRIFENIWKGLCSIFDTCLLRQSTSEASILLQIGKKCPTTQHWSITLFHQFQFSCCE